MRRHEACVEAVVGYEFRQRLSGPPENVVMQFDDRKRRRDRAIRPDPDGHLALDRQMREVVEIQSLAMPPDFAFEKAPSDWPLHPELLRGAWSRAANFVADKAIARRHPKLRDRVLELVSGGERQVEMRIGEASSGLPRAIVAPLAVRQFAQLRSREAASLGSRNEVSPGHLVATLAAV